MSWTQFEQMTFEPRIDSIDWNKKLGKIWAESCSWRPNSPWFQCVFLKLRLLPDHGYVKIGYDFQETDKSHDYPHVLEISRDSERPIANSFKIEVPHEQIQMVGFLGVESFDTLENLTIFSVNELLISTETHQLLVIPDWYTSVVKFTFENRAIQSYLETGWKENYRITDLELKRIKNWSQQNI